MTRLIMTIAKQIRNVAAIAAGGAGGLGLDPGAGGTVGAEAGAEGAQEGAGEAVALVGGGDAARFDLAEAEFGGELAVGGDGDEVEVGAKLGHPQGARHSGVIAALSQARRWRSA